MAKPTPPQTKREFPKELKRQVVSDIDSGKMTFADARKKYGLTDHQLKAWWGQVRDTSPPAAPVSDETTQDLERRLLSDAMAGKIGGPQLRLDILELIFKSIRQEK